MLPRLDLSASSFRKRSCNLMQFVSEPDQYERVLPHQCSPGATPFHMILAWLSGTLLEKPRRHQVRRVKHSLPQQFVYVMEFDLLLVTSNCILTRVEKECFGAILCQIHSIYFGAHASKSLRARS